MTTLAIFIMLCIGIALGLTCGSTFTHIPLDRGISYVLYALVFTSGISFGFNKAAIRDIFKQKWSLLYTPLGTAAGSLMGSLLFGMLVGLPIWQGAAIGAGFGWYSLSAVMLSSYSAELGTIAFFSNVFREVIALLAIPFLATRLSAHCAISISGATAMDTTLPLIVRYSPSWGTIASFISGLCLSMMVPPIISMLLGIGGA